MHTHAYVLDSRLPIANYCSAILGRGAGTPPLPLMTLLKDTRVVHREMHTCMRSAHTCSTHMCSAHTCTFTCAHSHVHHKHRYTKSTQAQTEI